MYMSGAIVNSGVRPNTQGQLTLGLVSGPFGYGWNLWGTTDYKTNTALVDARFSWGFSPVVIVLGHVVAVYLAHLAALRLFGRHSQAVHSQYPS